MEHISTLLTTILDRLTAQYENSMTMKKMNESIAELTGFLYRKGYDGLYRLGEKGPDKLDVLLKSQLLLAISKPLEDHLPLKVDTIASLADEQGRYTQCRFYIDCQVGKGAFITGFTGEVIDAQRAQVLYTQSRVISHKGQIPAKADAVKVLYRKARGRAKGIRF